MPFDGTATKEIFGWIPDDGKHAIVTRETIRPSSNGTFVAECPLHPDEIGTLQFYPGDGRAFYCLGCGSSGMYFQNELSSIEIVATGYPDHKAAP
jgi:hypothetical protein